MLIQTEIGRQERWRRKTEGGPCKRGSVQRLSAKGREGDESNRMRGTRGARDCRRRNEGERQPLSSIQNASVQRIQRETERKNEGERERERQRQGWGSRRESDRRRQ